MIFPIPALKDNYIWCLHDNKNCAIVDPGEANPVIETLEKHSLTLTAILITHHHYDHTNGIDALLEYKKVPVFGSKEIAPATVPVSDNFNFTLDLMGMSFTTLGIPGHTKEHVAYYQPGSVFTGDTLFTAGCGRIFEGTITQMYTSLSKLASLPEDTLIYCGHEYTENNLKFALHIEPHNREIQNRLNEVQILRKKNLPTVPATLALERNTNPFLRCDQPEVIASVSEYAKKPLQDPIEVFGFLREYKNRF